MSNEIVMYGPDESLIGQLRDAAPDGVEIQWVDSNQDQEESARALSNTRAIILGGAIDFEVELAAKCPELRLIQTTSAGTDKLDKAALGELGIKVSNNKKAKHDYNTRKEGMDIQDADYEDVE